MFLEEQEKRRGAEIADLRAKLSESHVETIHGTVLATTVETGNIEAERRQTTEVPVGQELILQYPMKRLLSSSGATQVWMRRREVDRDVAAVTYSWVLLFEEKEGQPDRVFVGEFR